MKRTKEISPKTYAEWYGCHVSYIHRILMEEKIDKLPHVYSIKKYSRFYTLEVPKTLTEDSFKKINR